MKARTGPSQTLTLALTPTLTLTLTPTLTLTLTLSPALTLTLILTLILTLTLALTPTQAGRPERAASAGARGHAGADAASMKLVARWVQARREMVRGRARARVRVSSEP